MATLLDELSVTNLSFSTEKYYTSYVSCDGWTQVRVSGLAGGAVGVFVNLQWAASPYDGSIIYIDNVTIPTSYKGTISSGIKAKYLRLEIQNANYPTPATGVYVQSLFFRKAAGTSLESLQNAGNGLELYIPSTHKLRTLVSTDSSIYITNTTTDVVDLSINAPAFNSTLIALNANLNIFNSSNILSVANPTCFNNPQNNLIMNNCAPETLVVAYRADENYNIVLDPYPLPQLTNNYTGISGRNNNILLGVGAGYGSDTNFNNCVGIGKNSLYACSGIYAVAIGNDAGQVAQSYSVHIGKSSGDSAGRGSINIGSSSGAASKNNTINIGDSSGYNAAEDSINIGTLTNYNATTATRSIAIGYSALCCEPNQIALGSVALTSNVQFGIAQNTLINISGTGTTAIKMWPLQLGTTKYNIPLFPDTALNIYNTPASITVINNDVQITTIAANSFGIAVGKNGGLQDTIRINGGILSGTAGTNQAAYGYNAAGFNSGTYICAYGPYAGSSNLKSKTSYFGYSAGNSSANESSCGFGHRAGESGAGIGSICIGDEAGVLSSANYSVNIGYKCNGATTVGRLNFGNSMESITPITNISAQSPIGLLNIGWNGTHYKLPILSSTATNMSTSLNDWGQVYMNRNSWTGYTITLTTTYQELLPTSATYSSILSTNFSNPSTARLQYNGTTTKKFKIIFSVAQDSGNSLKFAIYKNGTIESQSELFNDTSRRVTSITIVEMAQSDYISIYAARQSNNLVHTFYDITLTATSLT